MLITILAAAIALQAAPALAPPSAEDAPQAAITLDTLPIEQSAAARCAIAYATVTSWQKAGDARGQAYPDAEASGGREFFVQVMAKLMDEAGLTRDDVVRLSFRGVEENDNPEGQVRIAQMMPACELMKSAAGL